KSGAFLVVFGVLATTFCPSAIRNALSASGAVRVRRRYGKSVALFRSFMLQGLYHFASFSFVVSAWIPRRSWRLLLIANFISSKLASIMSPSSTPRKKIFVFELPHDFIKIISFFFNMTLSLFVVVR
ncbi:hypothetical protein, partial [Klebsiella michiganensis]|uniref:hypothetical protein n=2 Tax=Klebsiella/Raoultella group TaxID=2890311 RepID=UPI00292E5DC3